MAPVRPGRYSRLCFNELKTRIAGSILCTCTIAGKASGSLGMNIRTRGFSLSLCLIGLAAAWAGPADAATYTYTGNSLSSYSSITTPCVPLSPGCGITNITAELVFAAPLAANLYFQTVTPTSWVISDGLSTVTDTTPGFSFVFPLGLSTDAGGNISEWLFHVYQPASVAGQLYELTTQNYPGQAAIDQTGYCQSITSTCIFADIANVTSNPGAWSQTVVPIPASAWFLGPAIAMLGWMRRQPVATASA